ncbi:MAG: PaaI family thioesterase [Ramlibacter sp.]|nr:PaaI family thioesterase [Ramlibacter sp.]
MDTRTFTDHDEIVAAFFAKLRSFPLPKGVELELPPRCAREAEARYVEYVPGEKLVGEIVVPERYANPLGQVQGGFLCAMFDNLMAPLCYAAAGPTTSIDISTSFVRPVTVGEKISIDARIRRVGRRAVHMTAEAFNKDGQLVATSTSNLIQMA